MDGSARRVRRRRRDERRDETRLLLLRAAALLFGTRGYQAVSLDAVAEEAGFSKGAVYAHFTSKQDLLAGLLEWHCEQQLGDVRSLLSEPMPFEERVRRIGAAYFGSSGDGEAASWCLRFVELWLQAMRDPGLRPRLSRLYEGTRRAVAEMIERETEGLGLVLAVPAGQVARGLLALGDGLMMQHVVEPSGDSAAAYASALQAMFQAALRPTDEEESHDGHDS